MGCLERRWRCPRRLEVEPVLEKRISMCIFFLSATRLTEISCSLMVVGRPVPSARVRSRMTHAHHVKRLADLVCGSTCWRRMSYSGSEISEGSRWRRSRRDASAHQVKTQVLRHRQRHATVHPEGALRVEAEFEVSEQEQALHGCRGRKAEQSNEHSLCLIRERNAEQCRGSCSIRAANEWIVGEPV